MAGTSLVFGFYFLIITTREYYYYEKDEIWDEIFEKMREIEMRLLGYWKRFGMRETERLRD